MAKKLEIEDDEPFAFTYGGICDCSHIDHDNNETQRFLNQGHTAEEIAERFPTDGRFNSDSSKDFDVGQLVNEQVLARTNIQLYEADKLKELVESTDKVLNS